MDAVLKAYDAMTPEQFEYNRRHNWLWSVNCAAADEKDPVEQKRLREHAKILQAELEQYGRDHFPV